MVMFLSFVSATLVLHAVVTLVLHPMLSWLGVVFGTGWAVIGAWRMGVLVMFQHERSTA
jgi:hypothetical protein